MTGSPAAKLMSILIFILPLGIAACAATQQAKFYTLESFATPGPSGVKAARPISVGVGPIDLAAYLDRPQIVTRSGPNELDISEYDRWAAPLDDTFASIIAQNISKLLHSDLVFTYPWQAEVDYEVTMNVLQFDGSFGGDAILIVRWSIYDRDGKQRVIRRSTYTAPVAGSNYQELVKAKNKLVDQLSREIAAALRAV